MRSIIILEPDDLSGGGQMIIRNSFSANASASADWGFASSVAYKIGWISHMPKNKACKISLSDGMVVVYESDQELIESLNEDPVGYRPMTQKEISHVMKYVGNRFNEV